MLEQSRIAPSARVLIADDNQDSRELYALYLSMLGYNVAVAVDGREAVESTRRHLPDVIVMDLDMPQVDGWAAICQLRSDAATAAIPIIVLTGHDFKAQLKDVALAAGAVSYLMKPCFPEDLAREVNARLAVHRARVSTAG
jgi:CheY-like chemotaxis protein